MTRLAVSIPEVQPSLAWPQAGSFRFNLQELSGSLGDLGTFLPLSLAVVLTCKMDLGVIFVFAGLMNIVTGLWFGLPIPVQPMKAIAAVAIAEGLSGEAIASAGMLTGAAVFILAMTGGVDWITRVVPKPVVRGIQAGIGIKLALKGLNWLASQPLFGWDSWIVALVVGLVVAMFIGHRQPILLYVFFLGLGLMWLNHPQEIRQAQPQLPTFHLIVPSSNDWWIGLMRGAVPQLPLTLLNSVVAVCALSADYFPGRGIEPRRMAASVGLMNLVCVPFGGMPMCHGAGGLAAQYRFGARTGGSVIMLGAVKLITGLLLGGALVTTLPHYPISILAVMVVVAGISLALAARDSLTGNHLIVIIAVVAVILVFNTFTGFAVGCATATIFTLARPISISSH